jgi:polysaccharide biosynthesis protein PslG
MMRRLVTVMTAFVLLHAAAHAREEPMILGVQTHFAFNSSRTDVGSFRAWMARARFHSSRDEMFWWHVEDPEGRLEMRQGALATREVWRSMPPPFKPLLTLDFGYQSYDGGGQPKSDAAVAAFSRYARFVVSQSQPLVRMVEVWNEWNLKAGARPEGGSDGNPRDYVHLAAATYQELKALNPEVQVIVGAISDDFPDWKWMRQATQLGLLERADGLSVHLYNHCMPAARVGSDELIQRLDALRTIMEAAGHASMPVYVTEAGWPTHSGKCAVGENDAALHSVRFLLEASLRPWVRGVWFYEMQDGGGDAADMEQHFGLLRRDGSEKPAGCALRELGAQIAARPSAILRAGQVTLARFASGRSERWFVWSHAPSGVASDATVRLTSQTGVLGRVQPVALCGLRQGTFMPQPDGRSAALSLPAGSILVIDAPPGESLLLETSR